MTFPKQVARVSHSTPSPLSAPSLLSHLPKSPTGLGGITLARRCGCFVCASRVASHIAIAAFCSTSPSCTLVSSTCFCSSPARLHSSVFLSSINKRRYSLYSSAAAARPPLLILERPAALFEVAAIRFDPFYKAMMVTRGYGITWFWF
jgi:hypothetical protein